MRSRLPLGDMEIFRCMPEGMHDDRVRGDGGGGHWLVRMEWYPAGWSVCLSLLVFRCIIKSRSFLLVPAHPGGPLKRAVKRLWWWGGGAWWHSAMSCAKMAELIEMPFGLWTRVGPRKHVLGGMHNAPSGEYHWIIYVWRQCGLLSIYFGHLLL